MEICIGCLFHGLGECIVRSSLRFCRGLTALLFSLTCKQTQHNGPWSKVTSLFFHYFLKSPVSIGVVSIVRVNAYKYRNVVNSPPSNLFFAFSPLYFFLRGGVISIALLIRSKSRSVSVMISFID